MDSLYMGYLRWHYGRAFRDIFVVWNNFVWFVLNFFSIPLLLKTLLSPWKRITENHERGAGLEDFFATIAVNVMSRLVGGIIRLAVVAFGLLILAVLLAGIVVFYAVWLFAPVALPLMFIGGVLTLL